MSEKISNIVEIAHNKSISSGTERRNESAATKVHKLQDSNSTGTICKQKNAYFTYFIYFLILIALVNRQ